MTGMLIVVLLALLGVVTNITTAQAGMMGAMVLLLPGVRLLA